MAEFRPSGPHGIALVVSDVDGTLVTRDKRVTEATRLAVRRLADRGIGFTITSSRPPFGLKGVIEALDLRLPLGPFNGGMLVRPDLTVVEEHLIPEEAARTAVQALEAQGIGAWVFADGRWLLTDPHGDYVERERRTIATDPVVVPDLGPHLARAGKIVGASRDFAGLSALETSLQAALAGRASVARSQDYYLDVTPAGVDKGTVVDALSRLTGVPRDQIAALGDMANDLPMLARVGLPIAMGNATAAVKALARHVTLSNDEDGVAHAIDRYVLGEPAVS